MAMSSGNSSRGDGIGADNDDALFELEIQRLFGDLRRASASFETAELVIICLGVLANSLGSLVLLRSRNMRTASFAYHKAMGLANLTFCCNYLLLKLVRQYQTVKLHQNLIFTNFLAAFFTGLLSRALGSTCGYFFMYTSALITIDRFFAISNFSLYRQFNRKSVALANIFFSLLLSLVVNSWSTWVEHEVKDYPFVGDLSATAAEEDDRSPESSSVSPPPLTHIFVVEPANMDEALKIAVSVKDIYNLVIRLSYAVGQMLLTGVIVRALRRRSEARSRLKAAVSGPGGVGGGGGGGKEHRRQSGRERCLSGLMLAVACMSCIQVLPREFRRIFDLAYPIDAVQVAISDRTLAWATRRYYLRLMIYGHGYVRVIANFLTAVERSALFYLHFLLNFHFRAETLAPLLRAFRFLLKKRNQKFNGGHAYRLTVNGKEMQQQSPDDERSIVAALRMNRSLSSFITMLYASNSNSAENVAAVSAL